MPFDIVVGRDEVDKKRFGEKGLVYIGKQFVKMGETSSLSNKIHLDVARSHVILVAGKRGSGKCLHEDTLITLADGSQIPIKDLENNNERVLSLNEKLKIEEVKKTEFFSREVEKILKIKLRSGKELKLTPEHPLLTIKGWIPTNELKIGSRIATPRKSCFGKEEIPEHEIKLLAYLIAEGHIAKSYCLFSNTDKIIYNDFCEDIKIFDGNLRVVEWPKGREGCYGVTQKEKKYNIINAKRNEKGQLLEGSVRYQKSSIVKWLTNIGIYGKLAKEKIIPIKIIKLKKELLALFLNRLFSCDGSIYKTNDYWEIAYSSSSEKMIRQIQSLLLKFKVLSKLREKKIKTNNKEFNSFELVINSENSVKFIEEIGFFGKKHEKEFLAKQEILSKIRNTNIDTIPKEIWETYKPANWAEIGRALGYKYPKAMRERIRYSPSRQTLLKMAEVENYNPLYLLATSDIFWDEIVSVELLEGRFKVYDISVPENHNFVANDIIVHNSYTLGAIAEELASLPEEVAVNIATVIFDTMGIFWTMKYANQKEYELLKEWDLKGKKLPVRIFVPYGFFEDYEKRSLPVDEKFALSVSELTADDWLVTFNLEFTSRVAIVIQRAIEKLKGKERFDLDDIIFTIKEDEESESDAKQAALNLFYGAKTWGIFASKGMKETKTMDIVKGGGTAILDLSCYSSIGTFNVRALVIGLLCRKFFNERMFARKAEEVLAVQKGIDYLNYKQEREMPLIWLFLDEGHEMLPKKGKTAATDALIQVLREGRQPGISLVLATQQPGQIHTDVMTQSDIVISHRVTSKPDMEALNLIMQNYLLASIQSYMNSLPALKGSAIILDDNSERIYPMRVRPRFTWHGGEAPTAIRVEKRL